MSFSSILKIMDIYTSGGKKKERKEKEKNVNTSIRARIDTERGGKTRMFHFFSRASERNPNNRGPFESA